VEAGAQKAGCPPNQSGERLRAMNRVMKHVVDVAFRVRAFNRERRAAEAAGKPIPPRPKVMVDFLRGMVGLPLEGRIGDALTDEQKHRIVRATHVLDRFAGAGCPIVSIDETRSRRRRPQPRREPRSGRSGSRTASQSATARCS
jgi:hypothetical protein